MPKLKLVCMFAALLMSACSSPERKPEVQPIQCGVLNFESGAEMKPGEAESVTDLFIAALQSSGKFSVIERKQLSAVMQEREFQAAQEGENAERPGKLLAIHKMFSGSIGKLGDRYVINVKMIDIQSSQVEFAVSEKYDDDIAEIGEKLMPKLIEEIIVKIDRLKKREN
jgi:TolB-like protein